MGVEADQGQVRLAANEVLACGSVPCTAPTNNLQQVGDVSWDIPTAAGSYRVSFALQRDAEPLASNNYTIEVHAAAAAATDGRSDYW